MYILKQCISTHVLFSKKLDESISFNQIGENVETWGYEVLVIGALEWHKAEVSGEPWMPKSKWSGESRA